MTVGDVYWVDLPARGGRAQTGRRPAIIFQRNLNLPTVLLIPLTSQQDALRFAGTVLVEPDKQNGLHQPSIALVFQLTAVDKNFIAEKSDTPAKGGGLMNRIVSKTITFGYLLFDTQSFEYRY